MGVAFRITSHEPPSPSPTPAPAFVISRQVEPVQRAGLTPRTPIRELDAPPPCPPAAIPEEPAHSTDPGPVAVPEVSATPRRRGRPSKFTEDRWRIIIRAVRAGNYLCTAAALAGVEYRTLNRWLKDERPAFVQFRRRLRQAEAAWEAQNVAYITQHARKDPRLGLEALERRFRARWGRRDTSVTLRPGVPDPRRPEVEDLPLDATFGDLPTERVLDLYEAEVGVLPPEDRQRVLALDQVRSGISHSQEGRVP